MLISVANLVRPTLSPIGYSSGCCSSSRKLWATWVPLSWSRRASTSTPSSSSCSSWARSASWSPSSFGTYLAWEGGGGRAKIWRGCCPCVRLFTKPPSYLQECRAAKAESGGASTGGEAGAGLACHRLPVEGAVGSAAPARHGLLGVFVRRSSLLMMMLLCGEKGRGLKVLSPAYKQLSFTGFLVSGKRTSLACFRRSWARATSVM